MSMEETKGGGAVRKPTKDEPKGDISKPAESEVKPGDVAAGSAQSAPAIAAAPPADSGEAKAEDAKADAAPERFVVAPGCALTSAKGILGAGMEVKAEYLYGGEADFSRHKAKGRIVPAKTA
jgi:hypothetical protein